MKMKTIQRRIISSDNVFKIVGLIENINVYLRYAWKKHKLRI